MLFDIQRWSLHDGPGIRTTVFFKGCPLRCLWCSNPESWSFAPTLLHWPASCKGCGVCVAACPNQVIGWQGGQLTLDRQRCLGCGRCVPACAQGALELVGREEAPEHILDHLLRDAVFYRNSGGGVTFSGGEPFAQPDLLRQLVHGCVRAAIPLAVESCGYFHLDQVWDLIEDIDHIFIDLKHIHPTQHRRLTGVSNQRILDNIRRMDHHGYSLILRVPLVQGLNDTPDNIAGIIDFCNELQHLNGLELLPYHPLGEQKHLALGHSIPVALRAPDGKDLKYICRRLSASGLPVICTASSLESQP
jgi:pyruvate formate lyase activating enzyme